MVRKRIFAEGFLLPGDEFEYIEFDSDQTLLDADIVLFEPSLGKYSTAETYNGKPILSQHSSFVAKKRLVHWPSEIVAAVRAGKLVIVYLAKPIECHRYTGEKQFSGKGRSQVTTNIVTEVSSYEAVPNLKGVVAKSGKELRLQKDAKYLRTYWAEFSKYSPSEVEIDGESKKIILKTPDGVRTVGAVLHSSTGVLLFLPPLRYDKKKFIRYEDRSRKSFWTEEAVQFGKRLAATLSALADDLRHSTESTPPPDWAAESKYRLTAEDKLESELASCSVAIVELQAKKAALEPQLNQAGSLRHLLFEQGHRLEEAVLESLRLLGFQAERFADGESEFDAVFVSPEGRFLGEAEGKDNRPINIDKFSQLERNLQEDFAREEVTHYAKGVLFGNAFRLTPPNKRGEFFTEKCISAAKRVGAALVATPDLFAPAKYLKENRDDHGYAAECRVEIFRAAGEIAKFPAPPH